MSTVNMLVTALDWALKHVAKPTPGEYRRYYWQGDGLTYDEYIEDWNNKIRGANAILDAAKRRDCGKVHFNVGDGRKFAIFFGYDNPDAILVELVTSAMNEARDTTLAEMATLETEER